jgi:predicted acetyltransferase
MSSDATAYPVRPITEDETEDFNAQLNFGFHEEPPEEMQDLWVDLVSLERTVAAFDGDELVSTGGAVPFELTVPGGVTVPAAGVTMITVKATHRRRGILTAMMRHQLSGWHESGEASVAILWSSEPAIYGRYGYGLGTNALAVKVPRGGEGLSAVPGSDAFRMRMADPREAYDRCQEVFDAIRLDRPGMVSRIGKHWGDVATVDNEFTRDDAGPLRCVVAEDAAGTVAGYARYQVEASFENPARPDGKVEVREVFGRDLASHIAVWRFLTDLDLTLEVHAEIPTDDPLMFQLADPRQSVPRLQDVLYVRLVDVDRALAGRRYAAPVDVVFELADPFCPWNTGRWRLTGDADGAVCTRTTDPADLVLGPRELGTAYLCGFSLTALGQAGRVEELRPGALGAASRAFVSDVAPFAPFEF